jgi:hypothetical protein
MQSFLEEHDMNKHFLSLLIIASLCSAAQYDVVVSVANSSINQAWGKAYVLKNDLCSLSIVPKVGGRVMSYCLGNHSFLRIDASAGPGTYGPGSNDIFNGGGFINWPVPQVNWSSNTWPPPPYLSHGNYTDVVVSKSADSVVIAFTSPLEKYANAEGLVFRKVYTVYRATSRVKVDIRLINKNPAPKTWSIREVAQVWPAHAGQTDFAQFKAYFPRGTSALDSSRGFWYTGADTGGSTADLYSQFSLSKNGKVVNFQNKNKRGKIGVHPADQWIAYQDALEGYTFVQKGVFQPSATYPEYGGAVLIIYMGDWLEMELCAPQKNIPANDSLQFITNWYSTKLAGDILAINNAGAISDPLAIDPALGSASGTYGVFHQGTVKLWFNGQTSAAKTIAVSPLTTLTLNEKVTIPAKSLTASLLLYNAAGVFVDTLDSKNFKKVAEKTTAKSAVGN